MTSRVGIVGARGYVGGELWRLLSGHPLLEVAYLGSRSLAGERLGDFVYEALDAGAVAAREVDAVVLALPNGLSAEYVAAVDARQPDAVIVDLSADHRFDDGWVYGLPEHHRAAIAGARRVANPGCYATCAQLALEPLSARLTRAAVFGVSGYSGAGSTPSPKNDVELLRDNLVPYSLVGHVHEREIARHLGVGAGVVHFMPHVAPFFRGIAMTLDVELDAPASAGELCELYRSRYAGEALVRVQAEAPLVRDAAGRHHATVGGFACDGTRAVIVATLDNLLKGAATQALQNLELALGLPELGGIVLNG